MKIHPFLSSSISEKEWDSFVESSNNGTIFHTRNFLSYHPQDRFRDSSLVLTKNDKLFALFPAVIIERNGKRILSSHSGASYGGFVHTDDLNFKDAHDCVRLLKETASSMDCDAIQITLNPIIYQKHVSNYIDFALIRHNFTYLKREISSVVELPKHEDKIISLYREEARRAIRKAQKNAVRIIETDQFEQYYAILSKNLKMRHGVSPTHSLEELLRLKRKFPEAIRLWGAFLDDKLIAGVCNFSANFKVVLAFYISHDEEYQEYRPVNTLFYEIMKQSSREGFDYLDFGIFTVNMEPNWGLARFKENFGSRGIFRDTFYCELS